MKYRSIISISLIGSAITQEQQKGPLTPQQELNSIGKCIKENNCANDLTCQQSCHSANTQVYNNILNLQKCLSDCNPSLSVIDYQKCTASCNSNSIQNLKGSKDQDNSNVQKVEPSATFGNLSTKPTSVASNSNRKKSTITSSSSSKNYEFKPILTTLVSIAILVNLI